MQLNGIGGEHTQSAHQITNCIHGHAEKKDVSGGTGLNDKSVSVASRQQNADGWGLALPGWLRTIAAGGRQLWGRVWGDNTAPGEKAAAGAASRTTLADGSAGSLAAVLSPGQARQDPAQTMSDRNRPADGAMEVTEVSELAKAAAQSTLVPPVAKENPYFTPVGQEAREKNAWEKAKVKFQKITKYLSKRFSGQDSFQKGNDRPPRDMSKRSRYTGKDVQIDCILTDDSYLLDSYDRRGGYAKLSARK